MSSTDEQQRQQRMQRPMNTNYHSDDDNTTSDFSSGVQMRQLHDTTYLGYPRRIFHLEALTTTDKS